MLIKIPLIGWKVVRGREFELVKRVSGGDEIAFNELYDQTHKKVYFYLFRIFKEESLTEDIVVETYVEVWRNAKSFKGNSRVLTWIIGIARNLAMNRFKKMHYLERIDDFPDIPDQRTLRKPGLEMLSIKQLKSYL